MFFRTLFDSLKSRITQPPARRSRRAAGRRFVARTMLLEILEDRLLLTFAVGVDYPVGGNPQAVVTADFNNDGRLDLATANYGASNVDVLLGNANGTFQPALTSSTGVLPLSLAVGDFNDDGKLDLVTENSGSVSVLLGNGSGTFQTPRNVVLPGQFPPGYTGTTPLAQRPLSVTVGDVNRDGKLDLVVTGQTSSSVLTGYVNVLLGKGTGDFTAQSARLAAGSSPDSATLKDFNADGKLDLALTDDGMVRVFAGDGAGAFAAPTSYATGGSPQSVVVGDANGDGISDLVTKNYSSVSVLLGKGAAGVGDGTFQLARNTALDFQPDSLAVGDINADGKLDLVATSNVYYPGGYYSFGFYDSSVQVLLGHGDGTFAAPKAQTVANAYAYGATAGNFNGDGFADVAVVNGDSVSVLLNTQDWRSFVLSGMPSSTTAGVAQSVTVTALGTDLNVLTGYTGTVQFTSYDPQVVLPADYTFTAGDNGTHTFRVTLKTAGSWSLTVADTTTAGISGTQTGIVVTPAAASTFVLADLWSTMTSGDASYFSVTAFDAYGNQATNYAGTVRFTSTDGLATLPANYSFTASNSGAAGFIATLRTIGMQSVTVTDTANSGMTATQAGIEVIPLATITGPSVGLRNQALTFTLTAGVMPAGTVFSYAIDWNNDGIVDQTVSGPSGTAVQHVYASGGGYSIGVTATATVGGQNYTSYGAYQYVTVFDVSAGIQTDPGDATRKALVVEGSATAETLVFSPVTGNGVALSINGYSVGTFAAPGGVTFGHILVYGNGGNDSIRLTGGLAVSAFIFGGDGNDTVDASGSTANNVLAGGAGIDALTGGSGRDLLIGGLGADTLRGGGGDDILIGGSTAYDTNLTALDAVMKEWGRTDSTTYSNRVKHLNGTLGGGFNGSYYLTVKTVYDDATIDSLFGEAGTDWFFARKTGNRKDKVNDLSTGEVVTANRQLWLG